MSLPLISVHMPVYNAEPYVGEAVESILAQTCPDFEFIIINDGSTDRSLDILRRHADEDDRIRLVSRPNAGIGRTRNEALNLARGEFFAVMDADDVSLPQRFARQVEFLRSHPDHVAVGTAVLMVDPDGDPIREWIFHADHDEIDRAHMEGHGGALTHPSSMMRREAVVALGGYREELAPAEDYDLFLRLAERGRIANLPEVLFKYRQHSNSAGHKQFERQKRGGETALRDAYQRRGLPPPKDLQVRRGGRISPVEHHRKWAWWALDAGYVATARKHALSALRQAPFSTESWRAMLFAMRGH